MWSLRPDFLGVNPAWLSSNCGPWKIRNLLCLSVASPAKWEDDCNSSNQNCCEDEMGNTRKVRTGPGTE